MWKKIAVLAVLASVQCTPVSQNGAAEKIVSAISDCIENDTTMCLKEKAMKFTERLAVTKDFDLIEGMTLVNTGSARSARSYEPLAEEPKVRESQLEERIADNVGDFLDNHVLQLRLSEPEDSGRQLDEEGRGKKKKKIKQLLPFLLLLKLKFAALIPLFLGIIAFVAIKAVFLGKIAFAMSAITMIRKLLSKGGGGGGHSSSASYAPAHHEEHHDHPGYSYEPAAQSGWGRKASGDAANMAYSAYMQN